MQRQGKQLSLPHCETLKHQRRLLYNCRESTAINNMEPGQRIGVLRISVPDYGGVTVFRRPGGGTETVLEAYSITRKRIAPKSFPCCFFLLDYNVDNGCLLEKTRNEFGIESIRILASDGTVMVISRDSRQFLLSKTNTKLNHQH